ncbi:MAG TPA: double zinc ribbon domain-containing protein [Gemmatimonadales bacterium]|nr:double zinc ribbon domain-containing protein [Gemmatimonadales bacterium]
MASALEQLLLPAECVVCHALLPSERALDLVCPLCRYRWRPLVPPWCERCGNPEPLFGTCRICNEWPTVLQCVRSAVWLDPAARRAVHLLKYGGFSRLAEDLVEALARVRLDDRGAARLVPVPLSPARLRARGYNQSERLAQALGRRWDSPVADILVRTRDTVTQTALTPVARLANVAGAFSVGKAEAGTRNGGDPRCSAFPLPTCTLVLVDDVFTTGATLAAAAQALESAGATCVMGITFGRAVIPDFI